MSWSYDSSLSTDRDWVRWRTGSTNSADQSEMSNEEITATLAVYANRDVAALHVAKAILAKLSRDVDRSNLGMSATRSQRITHLKDLIAELKIETRAAAQPAWSGASQSAKDTVNADSDYVGSPFTRDRHKNDSSETGR